MNIKRAELAGTYFNARQLPADPRPKVLFLGRSNVGKSSLINALLGRRLARTSATPGKTLSVNYFAVDGRLLFADLPGYGYARVAKDEAARVRRLIADFLQRVRTRAWRCCSSTRGAASCPRTWRRWRRCWKKASPS